MKNSTVMIVASKDTPLAGLAATLETIRAIPARVSILVVGELPVFPFYAVGIPPYGISDVPDSWQDDLTESKAVLAAKVAEIEGLLQQHDVAGEVATIASDPGMIANAIAQRALYCDVALVSDDLREFANLFKQVLHGVLFNSPIGIVLNDRDGSAFGAAKRVFVAWNTQIHAARAVHQALPILQKADEVIVGSIDPAMPEASHGEDLGVDIATWLTHHGCNVTVQQYPSGGLDICDAILARAKEARADLVVMGAYGHSRTREALFGGTTRSLIAQTEQPVYLVY